jgi:SAM-dependent methyltransferase
MSPPPAAQAALHVREHLDELLKAAYVPPWPSATYEWFRDYSVTQTLMFYIDMLPYVHFLLGKLPYGRKISILDAGCGSGAGADLLGRLHSSTFLGHSYDVTGVDLYSTYKDFADIAFPNMTYVVGDLFTFEDCSYDVVLCSHVIEHFIDPTDFIRKLQSIARYFALFYCPYEEKKLLEGGHLRSIDRTFAEAFNPAVVQVRQSVAWRHPHDKDSMCLIFVLPGPQWQELNRPRVVDWLGQSALSSLDIF